MRPLISDSINSKLDEIVTKLFEGNRIMDRGMTQLGVKFAMNKTESLLHSKLAHLFPLLADKVSEYQSDRNNLTFYGATPADNTDYKTPLAFFERILDYMMDLEGLISETIERVKDDDKPTFSFLLSFMNQITKVTAQCLLLVDKGEFYKDDWMAFDARVDDFVVL